MQSLGDNSGRGRNVTESKHYRKRTFRTETPTYGDVRTNTERTPGAGRRGLQSDHAGPETIPKRFQNEGSTGDVYETKIEHKMVVEETQLLLRKWRRVAITERGRMRPLAPTDGGTAKLSCRSGDDTKNISK
jgi:hypothetical protein